jgi:hypothetical protein
LQDHKFLLPEQKGNSTMTGGVWGWMAEGPLDKSRKVADILTAPKTFTILAV